MTINQLLAALETATPSERAVLKATEFFDRIKSFPKVRIPYKGDNYDIQATSVELLQGGGIAVFARAWKNDVQLGFGDGSVDIERFRIFNPPILVDDPSGTIIRESTVYDIVTKQNVTTTRKLKVDFLEALKQSLVHTISNVGMEGTTIVAGSRGNTTSTFYPAAGANAPVDGYLSKNAIDTYANVRNAATATNVDVTTPEIPWITNYKDGSTFYCRRGVIGFDLTAVGTDTISSAVLTITGTSKENTNSDSINIVSTAPASQNNLVAADYAVANFGSTVYATITAAAWGAGAQDFTLNADGLAYLSTFYGLSNHIGFFGTRGSLDLSTTAPTGGNTLNGYQSDQTGTASDPKLVVVHSASTANSGFFNFM